MDREIKTKMGQKERQLTERKADGQIESQIDREKDRSIECTESQMNRKKGRWIEIKVGRQRERQIKRERQVDK